MDFRIWADVGFGLYGSGIRGWDLDVGSIVQGLLMSLMEDLQLGLRESLEGKSWRYLYGLRFWWCALC